MMGSGIDGESEGARAPEYLVISWGGRFDLVISGLQVRIPGEYHSDWTKR